MEHVEGEWNGFIFRRAIADDKDIISQFLRESYFKDEPLTVSMTYDEIYEEDFRKLWGYFLKDDLSFLVFHKESNKVAGVRLIFEHKKDMDWTIFDLKAPQTAAIMSCIKALDNISNIFEQYNIDTYADLFTTAVAKEFRQQGLVTEMYRRSILLARARNFYLAKACFSSPYSRKGAANAGFQQIASIDVKDQMDENGQQLIPNGQHLVITQSICILK